MKYKRAPQRMACLVTHPVSHEIVQAPTGDLTKTRSGFKQLAIAQCIGFLDLSEIYTGQLECFYNQNHVTPLAAEYVTEQNPKKYFDRYSISHADRSSAWQRSQIPRAPDLKETLWLSQASWVAKLKLLNFVRSVY